MKKRILFIIYILFYGCNIKGIEKETEFKIINNYDFNYKSNNTTYKCGNLSNKDEFGNLEILQVKSNLIKIKCLYNVGYGGEVVEILIDNKLKIENISYKYNDDTAGGVEDIYKVIASKLVLNKNPFIQGFNNIKGELEIKGEVEIKGDGIFEPSKKEKFNFFGYLICE